MIQSYKDLIVWQKATELVKEVYKLTSKFPPQEIYGLTSQMRRAAVSIPSNIAEGSYRNTRKDYIQFLRIAQGSAAELGTQSEIAEQLSFGQQIDYTKIGLLLTEVQKMLSRLISQLKPNP